MSERPGCNDARTTQATHWDLYGRLRDDARLCDATLADLRIPESYGTVRRTARGPFGVRRVGQASHPRPLAAARQPSATLIGNTKVIVVSTREFSSFQRVARVLIVLGFIAIGAVGILIATVSFAQDAAKSAPAPAPATNPPTNQRYTFSWPLSADPALAPRGGTTRGPEIVLHTRIGRGVTGTRPRN